MLRPLESVHPSTHHIRYITIPVPRYPLGRNTECYRSNGAAEGLRGWCVRADVLSNSRLIAGSRAGGQGSMRTDVRAAWPGLGAGRRGGGGNERRAQKARDAREEEAARWKKS